MSEPSWTPESWGPSGSERERERLPKLEDLPVASEGYDQDAVRRAFDDFYRHAAQLDATLQVLESVEAFGRQARDLRADIRSLRGAAWGPLPDLTSTWTTPSTTRRTVIEPAGGVADALPRVLTEAAFIILVAVGTAFADVQTVWVIALISGAFLLVALFEVAISAARPPRAPLVTAPPVAGEDVVVVEEQVAPQEGVVEPAVVEPVSEESEERIVEVEEEVVPAAIVEREDEPAESEPIVAAALEEVVELEPREEVPEPLPAEAPFVEEELAPAAFVEAEESEPIVEAATEGELVELELREEAPEPFLAEAPLVEDELAPAAFVEAEESEPIVEAATEGELIEPSLEEDADEALVEPEPLQPAAEAVPEPARRGWRFWRSPRAVEPPAEPDAVHRSHVRVLVPEPTAEEEALEQFVEPVEEPELARAEEPIPDPEPVVPAELIEVELPTPPEPEPVSERLDGWPSAADFEPRAADEETEVPAGSEDTLLHAEGPGSPEENGSAVEAPLEPAAESATEEPEAVFGWQQEPEIVPEPVEHRPGRRWFLRRRSEEHAVPASPLEDLGIEDEPELLAASADEAALAGEHGIGEPRAAEPDVVEPVEETPRETELDREEVVLVRQRREPPSPPAASLRRGRR